MAVLSNVDEISILIFVYLCISVPIEWEKCDILSYKVKKNNWVSYPKNLSESSKKLGWLDQKLGWVIQELGWVDQSLFGWVGFFGWDVLIPVKIVLVLGENH